MHFLLAISQDSLLRVGFRIWRSTTLKFLTLSLAHVQRVIGLLRVFSFG